MNAFRMPVFTWDMVVTSLLVLLAFPVLTAAGALLFIDRNLDGHVFDLAGGGVPILWQHLFWFFGHPEVYIIVLPYFGVITEIIPVFSRRPLFGYAGLVFATIAIAALSVGVWPTTCSSPGRPAPVLLRALVPHRGADWHQVRQLDRVHVGWSDPVLRAHAVLDRLPRAVPARRTDRGDAGVAAAGLPGQRHVLRRGPLPLHAGGRVGVRRVRRALLLVPQVHREDAGRAAGQGPLLAVLHRLQHDVLRPARPRGQRDAPPGGVLPGERRVRAVEPRVEHRRLHPGHRRARAGDQPGPHVPARPRRRRRPVGGLHARVGDDLAAPAAQLDGPLPPITSERPLFDLRQRQLAAGGEEP